MKCSSLSPGVCHVSCLLFLSHIPISASQTGVCRQLTLSGDVWEPPLDSSDPVEQTMTHRTLGLCVSVCVWPLGQVSGGGTKVEQQSGCDSQLSVNPFPLVRVCFLAAECHWSVCWRTRSTPVCAAPLGVVLHCHYLCDWGDRQMQFRSFLSHAALHASVIYIIYISCWRRLIDLNYTLCRLSSYRWNQGSALQIEWIVTFTTWNSLLDVT